MTYTPQVRGGPVKVWGQVVGWELGSAGGRGEAADGCRPSRC